MICSIFRPTLQLCIYLFPQNFKPTLMDQFAAEQEFIISRQQWKEVLMKKEPLPDLSPDIQELLMMFQSLSLVRFFYLEGSGMRHISYVSFLDASMMIYSYPPISASTLNCRFLLKYGELMPKPTFSYVILVVILVLYRQGFSQSSLNFISAKEQSERVKQTSYAQSDSLAQTESKYWVLSLQYQKINTSEQMASSVSMVLMGQLSDMSQVPLYQYRLIVIPSLLSLTKSLCLWKKSLIQRSWLLDGMTSKNFLPLFCPFSIPWQVQLTSQMQGFQLRLMTSYSSIKLYIFTPISLDASFLYSSSTSWIVFFLLIDLRKMRPASKSILSKVAYSSPSIVALVKVISVFPSARLVVNLSSMPAKFLISDRQICSGIHPVSRQVRSAISMQSILATKLSQISINDRLEGVLYEMGSILVVPLMQILIPVGSKQQVSKWMKWFYQY